MTYQSLTKPNRDFFPALQGLRGIAILFVVVAHLGDRGLFLFPIPHYYIGKVGVWIFFVLSAFLLTKNLYKDIELTSLKLLSILKYAVHRIFRIYPLFIIVLFLHLIRGHISVLEVLKHLALIQGRSELWAISVEFQYYFLIPVIVIVALHLPQKYIWSFLITALISSLLYCMAYPGEVFLNRLNVIYKLAPFLFGSMLFLQIRAKNNSSLTQFRFAFLIPIISLTFFLITIILYWNMRSDVIPIMYAPWLSVAFSISILGIVYSALRLPAFEKLLAVKPLVFIGEISFSIYLLHMFFVEILMTKSNLSPFIQAWSSLALSILFAYISYLTIEKPGIRTGKKLAQLIEKLYFRYKIISTIPDEERA